MLERVARINKYNNGGNEANLNPKLKNRRAAREKKDKDNGLFNDEQIALLKKSFRKKLYKHQKEWLEHGSKYMMRQYIKSRQIGATYYFALEALIVALETGKNQIFIWNPEQTIKNGLDIIPLFQSNYNGDYYDLPFSIDAHSKYFYQLLYIRSALNVKANILGSCLVKNNLFSQQKMSRLAMDYLWFGNGYLEKIISRTGKLLSINHSPEKYTRRDKSCYKFVTDGKIHKYRPESVYHLIQYDVNQELYGVPEWLPAVQSAQLNEEATKFRLRYYRNGSHAGYIMYLTDSSFLDEDIDSLKEELKKSKGPGNFRNLLLYSPNGKSDGIKLIPISEVTAKDEFFNIKSISRDDQLAAARVPPNIMGIVPTNTSGFGSVTDHAKVFARNEIEPLQRMFEELNGWLEQDVFIFEAYKIASEEVTD